MDKRMNLDPINKNVGDLKKEYTIKECKITRRSN